MASIMEANKTVTLCEAEAARLCDEARKLMLNDARERVRHPEAHTEPMLAASDVYGALSGIRFEEVAGLPAPPESAKVEFTERAMAWMAKLRDEIRASLEDGRGTVEINAEHTPSDTFLVFILDGILAAVAVTA